MLDHGATVASYSEHDHNGLMSQQQEFIFDLQLRIHGLNAKLLERKEKNKKKLTILLANSPAD